MGSRREIPSEIRLAVRRRDGFGCVVCGCPIFEYEHFVEYSKIGQHAFDNIYLACDNHHRKKGKLYSRGLIEKARLNPRNRSGPRSAIEQLGFYGDQYTLTMGKGKLSITGRERAAALVVDGTTLLGFRRLEEGVLLLDLLLKDQAGATLLSIVESEVRINTQDNWDVDWSPTSTLRIRQSHHEVSIRVVFDADRNSVHIQSARLYHAGRLVDVKPSAMHIDGNQIGAFQSIDADVMVCVGSELPHTESCSIFIQ